MISYYFNWFDVKLIILGYSFDDTITSWLLTVLMMLFMFCAGVAIVSFPWMLMGEALFQIQLNDNLKTCYRSWVVQSRPQFFGSNYSRYFQLCDDLRGGADIQPPPWPARHRRPLPLLQRGVRCHDALHRIMCSGDWRKDVLHRQRW